MISEERETLFRVLADTIREASQAGQLPGKDELSVNLRAHGLLGEDEAVFPEMDALLTETLEIHHDLAALESTRDEPSTTLPRCLAEPMRPSLTARPHR
jgi:hypothetical protein